jgi:hypothetical protein
MRRRPARCRDLQLRCAATHDQLAHPHRKARYGEVVDAPRAVAADDMLGDLADPFDAETTTGLLVAERSRSCERGRYVTARRHAARQSSRGPRLLRHDDQPGRPAHVDSAAPGQDLRPLRPISSRYPRHHHIRTRTHRCRRPSHQTTLGRCAGCGLCLVRMEAVDPVPSSCQPRLSRRVIWSAVTHPTSAILPLV